MRIDWVCWLLWLVGLLWERCGPASLPLIGSVVVVGDDLCRGSAVWCIGSMRRNRRYVVEYDVCGSSCGECGMCGRVRRERRIRSAEGGQCCVCHCCIACSECTSEGVSYHIAVRRCAVS